jgi:Thioredoxin
MPQSVAISREPAIAAASDFETVSRARSGLSVQDFMAGWLSVVEAQLKGLSREERRTRHYIRYNWERFQRVSAAYQMSPEAQETFKVIPGKQTWLFLTEYWCVDAAYSLPVVLAAAKAQGNVDLRFLMRDENLDIMERHLTNGARAIPILATFEGHSPEQIKWGSKPGLLARHRKELQESGSTGAELSAATIDWYEAEGWCEVEREILALARVLP